MQNLSLFGGESRPSRRGQAALELMSTAQSMLAQLVQARDNVTAAMNSAHPEEMMVAPAQVPAPQPVLQEVPSKPTENRPIETHPPVDPTAPVNSTNLLTSEEASPAPYLDDLQATQQAEMHRQAAAAARAVYDEMDNDATARSN